MEEEGRIVPAGRTAEGKAVGVRQTGPPWRFWYEGREIAGPEGGAVEKGRYVVKQKGGNLELLRREVVKGEGWAVWIDDEALGEYEKARVVVHPPSLTRGVPHPTHTNGAPLNTIAAFFSSGRHLLGGGNLLSCPCSTKIDPTTSTTDATDVNFNAFLPSASLHRKVITIIEADEDHEDTDAKKVQLVQWFKENEARFALGTRLSDDSAKQLCESIKMMLQLLAEAVEREDELFFSIYISQAVAKVGLVLLLYKRKAAGSDKELKRACNDLANELRGDSTKNMVFYELEWLRKGLAVTEEQFTMSRADILVTCVKSIASASPAPVIEELLGLGRQAFTVQKSISEHNHYFGIAAIERTTAVVKTWLLGRYHLAGEAEKKEAVAKLREQLFEMQSERANLRKWEVAFAWVKLMADILTFRPAIVTEDSIKSLAARDKSKALDRSGLTLDRLREQGWVAALTFETGVTVYVLSESLPGVWRADPCLTGHVTKQLRTLPRLAVPQHLQELLVKEESAFGEDEGQKKKFHGLVHFAKMGMSTPQGLMRVLEEAGKWLEERRPVGESEEGLQGLYNKGLNGAADYAQLFLENEKDIWRLRDRAVVACCEVIGSVGKEQCKGQWTQELQATLTTCKVFEQNSNVRRSLGSPDVYKRTAAFLKTSWKTQEEEVLESIRTTMDRLEELQQKLLYCEPTTRGKLEDVMKSVHRDLGFQVRSLVGKAEKLDIGLEFLLDMQQRQYAMERDLKELKGDMKKLMIHFEMDASIPDICKERMTEVVTHMKCGESVYIALYGDEVEVDQVIENKLSSDYLEHEGSISPVTAFIGPPPMTLIPVYNNANSQFAAVGVGLGLDAAALRKRVVDQMVERLCYKEAFWKDETKEATNEAWEEYVENMRKETTRGDTLTLRACAEVLRTIIWVLDAANQTFTRAWAPEGVHHVTVVAFSPPKYNGVSATESLLSLLRTSKYASIQRSENVGEGDNDTFLPSSPCLSSPGQTPELMCHVQTMLADATKNTLLITGKSGSGKSTFMKRLHVALWEEYWGVLRGGEGVFTIPVFCSLPELRDPCSSLVEEAFAKWGVQGPLLRRIRKDCRAGKCRLIFILDSYNEMSADHQYTNLYQSNNLRKWGEKQLDDKPGNAPFPKVIVTSRYEHLGSHSHYRSFFYPVQEHTRVDFKDAFCEVRIRDFRKRTCEYLNRDYEDQMEKLRLKHGVSVEYVNELVKMSKETAVVVQTEEQTEKPYTSPVEELKKKLVASSPTYDSHDHENKCTIDDINKLTSVSGERRFLSELQNIWSPLKLFRAAANSVGQLRSTPFMLSILVKVIPIMFSEDNDEGYMCEKFLRMMPEGVGEQLLPLAKHYEFDPSHAAKLLVGLDDKTKHTLSLEETTRLALHTCKLPKAILKYDTYHTFVNQLFDKSLPKLSAKHSSIHVEDLRSDLQNFCKTFARQMTLNNKVRVHYASSGREFRSRSCWDEHFSSDSTLLKDIRDGAPLQTEQAGVGGRYYAFIHKSIQESFVAQLIYDSIMRFPMLENLPVVKGFVSYFLNCRSVADWNQLKTVLPGMRMHFVNTCASKFHIDRNVVPATLTQIVDVVEADWSRLNTALVINDKAVMSQFLTPKVRADKKFQRALLSLVELSKLPYAQVPASMAISILNSAVSFSGMDLSGIRVPKAELSSAVFHETDLSGADLCGSDLSGSYFHKTRLDGADMKDVDFKQEPDITHRGVRSIATTTKQGEELWATVSWDAIRVGRYAALNFDGGTTLWDPIGCKFHGDILRVAATTGIYDVEMNNETLNIKKSSHQLKFNSNETIKMLTFSNDGSTLIAGTNKGNIQVIDANGVHPLYNAPLRERIWSLAILSEQESGNSIQTAIGYKEEAYHAPCDSDETGLQYTHGRPDGNPIPITESCLQYDPHGRYLAVVGGNRSGHKNMLLECRIIDIRKGGVKTVIRGQEKMSQTVQFSPDGQVLAIGVYSGIQTWSVSTGIELRTFELPMAVTVCFSDARMAAASVSDNAVKMWNIQDSEKIRGLAGHTGGIGEAIITPDGQYIVTSGLVDQKIKKWDLETGELLVSSTPCNSALTCVSLSGAANVHWQAEGVAWCADLICPDFHYKRYHTLVAREGDVLLSGKKQMHVLTVRSRSSKMPPAITLSPDCRHAIVYDVKTNLQTILKLADIDESVGRPTSSCSGHGLACFSSDGSQFAFIGKRQQPNVIKIGSVSDLVSKDMKQTHGMWSLVLRTSDRRGRVSECSIDYEEVVLKVKPLEIHGAPPMCFSQDGRYIAYSPKTSGTGCRQSQIFIDVAGKVSKKVRKGVPLHTINVYRGTVSQISFKGDYLLAVCRQSSMLWKRSILGESARLRRDTHDLALVHQNGKRVCTWLVHREFSKVETPLECIDCGVDTTLNLSGNNREILRQRQGGASIPGLSIVPPEIGLAATMPRVSRGRSAMRDKKKKKNGIFRDEIIQQKRAMSCNRSEESLAKVTKATGNKPVLLEA
eukprot:TRINITY_DN1476_c0_g2_i1.p1 TRINITY_DN1476_c0_g2~~TRINITY_DN1476_c0_g2_i1.p1  ORF type:complete len:2482 (+),score=591.19 TRINITY_DN1476_c0_g2_i1:75-7520(+)